MARPEPREVSPAEAARELERGDAVYLDVRTEEEFRQGHPVGALNVPFFVLDPRLAQPCLNPDFLPVALHAVGDVSRVLVGCATGVRSLHAARLLCERGLDAVNVAAGFHGTTDPFGRPLAPGWVTCGLPVRDGEAGPRSFDALRRAAGF